MAEKNSHWYRTLQLYRGVAPPGSSVDESGRPECYALAVRNAQLPNEKIDVPNRIHAYFYERKQKCYFGKPFCSGWYRSIAGCVLFSEKMRLQQLRVRCKTVMVNKSACTQVLFFWCSFHDQIDIVLEIVEGEHIEGNPTLYTAAWTSFPLARTGSALADYKSTNQELLYCKIPIYLGSPKALIFLDSDIEATQLLRKANGSLEVCLQTHQKMYSVLNYIPEWQIFGQKDDIPGLRIFPDGVSQLADPEVLEGRSYILKQISVSFDMDVDSFEQVLLRLINNDRLYRANRSPADISVKPMEVLERRITIGVHNGVRYVEGPQCLRLSLLENHMCGTLERRRNYKIITRSNADSNPQRQRLLLNASVILNGIVADPRYAIVFSLDYLVGVYANDTTVYSSHSIMLCWGAWCPFASHSEDQSSHSQITIALLGGPSINPDERLCFKNMRTFRHCSSMNLSRITVTFTFSELKEDKQTQEISIPDDSKARQNDVKSPSKESIEILPDTSFQTGRKIEKMRRKKFETKCSRSASSAEEKHFEKISPNICEKKEVSLAEQIYSLPPMRIANICRASLVELSNVSFSTIKDRNGNEPKYVNVERFHVPDINIELNDKLNTNETIVQFMAISFSCQENRSIKIPAAVFFTMHFYRFQTVTTERLLLDPVLTKTGQQEQLYFLMRNVDDFNEEKNGFTVKYLIDRNSLPDAAEDDYISYLLHGHLIVNVWDADSLLFLGLSYIPLKYLLRHGYEAVQLDVQSTVVLSSVPEPSAVTCQILVKMANVGHPSTKKIDLTRSRTKAIVSRKLNPISQDEIESYRIRAKPLNPIHENALQRFLAAQRMDLIHRYDEVINEDSLRTKERETIPRPLTTKGTMKRYLYQQELEAYKKMRNEDKASKLLKAVFKSITTEYRIYPVYGQTLFFEFLLQNTEAEAMIIVVDIAQNTLRPLLDCKLWQYYKNLYRIETSLEDQLYRVLEENGNIVEVQIYLKPMESIYAPFIYDGFSLPQEQISNQVKAIFKKKIGGEPIAILDLLVESRHNVITNSFRFYHQAETEFSKIIRITGYEDKGRVYAVRCTDLFVLLNLENNSDGSQDVKFIFQTGKAPTLRTFTVIFFADKYYDIILGAWSVSIHAVNRINVNAIHGQLTKIPIISKVDDNDHVVQLSSSSIKLEICPTNSATVQRGGHIDFVANFTPDFTGVSAILVSATDQRTKNLLNLWMIVVDTREANITKIFEVYLENKRSQTVRLAVGNRYGVERSFRISCSHPEYVRIENDIVNLAPYKIADVCIIFEPNKEPQLPEVLIFVTNMENNLLEEAYSLKLIYHESY